MTIPVPDAWSWHRRVLKLAVPIIAANLTQPMLSTVDTAIAGHLSGAASLGGAALGGLFFNIVFWGLGFLRMSTTGLVATAYGAQDQTALRDHLLRALILAVCAGAVLLAVKGPLTATAVRLFGGGAVVSEAASGYIAARLWSVPLTLANFVILGYLLGCQRTGLALLVQGVINAVNVILAVGLVYGLNLDLVGLGSATALADTAGFVAGVAILWRLRAENLPTLRWRRLLAFSALRRLMAANADIFLRTLCLIVCFTWFTHAGSRQGDVILAANAVLLTLQTVMAYLLDGFAQAGEALVGAAIGAGERTSYRRVIRVSTQWAVLTAGLFSLVYALAGSLIVRGLTDNAPVRQAAIAFLPWAVASPLVSVWSFQLDGFFIGATRTRDMRNGMMFAMLSFLLAASSLPEMFGNHGLWASFLIFMVARAAALWLFLPHIERDGFLAAE
ncbi:MATE family efflux transporter [Telmatospirillum siberiense]|uniref:MATE family efflux transporter n=1 Tax=Telmatospirillum siberiense TaxID=382514 RepID=A0A2N3PTY3_9PROT|nr:MATE family efflux transporter [Telmatospirillum siberiense]PKU23853.1 MATE family efflux transporter [Telmatospirillum siberiense]